MNSCELLIRRALARFIRSQETQDEVERRLKNWRDWMNWCDVWNASQGTCGSAERRYRPEKLTQAESDARSASNGATPIDVTDAERVDLALRHLPRHITDLLRRRYYKCESPWKIARVLGLGENLMALEEQRLIALMLLARRLSLMDMVAANRRMPLRQQVA